MGICDWFRFGRGCWYIDFTRNEYRCDDGNERSTQRHNRIYHRRNWQHTRCDVWGNIPWAGREFRDMEDIGGVEGLHRICYFNYLFALATRRDYECKI